MLEGVCVFVSVVVDVIVIVLVIVTLGVPDKDAVTEGVPVSVLVLLAD